MIPSDTPTILPDLVEPPKRFDWSNLLPLTIFMVLAIDCFWNANIIGGLIDLAVLALLLAFIIWRWRAASRLQAEYRRLKALKRVLETPRLRQEGNNVIFTFVAPHQHLMPNPEEKSDS